MRSSPFRLVLAAAVIAGLAACASGGGATETGELSSSDGAFPVTVPSEFGDVTVAERPERVVALGWGDAETALALGVQPVGASDWLSFGGEGVGPWAEGLYDTAPEIIDYAEPSFEAIAALEPDLILDVRGSGEQERYDTLSTIATTIGVPEGGGSFLTTAEQQVTTIAAALGVPERGAELVDGMDDAFAAVREAHPEWDGLTVTAATKSSSGWGAYSAGNARIGFLERMGFAFSPTIAALPDGSTGRSVEIAAEQLELLDADLLVAFPIWIDAAEMTEDPLWQRIPAVEDGRAVVLDGDLQRAYSLGSVLSIGFATERFTPLLEEALGG